MAMQFRTYTIPLSSGIDTGKNPQALRAPGLLGLKNGTFDEQGGIQTRRPFSTLSNTIASGGTLSTIRRIVPYGDELLAFTKDRIYSYSAAGDEWIDRAEYLAPKLTERAVFIDTTEQTLADRAELGGVTFFAWKSQGGSAVVYLAAVDSTTGAVILAPTSQGASTDRPRLVAITNRVLFFAKTAANTIGAKSLDPTDVSTSAAAAFTTIDGTNFNDYYDVARLSASLAMLAYRRVTTTSYSVLAVDESLATSYVKTPARTCDGPIAVAVRPDLNQTAVIRGSGTNVEGDILSKTLNDTAPGLAYGTASASPNQIAAAFVTDTDKCYAFWSASESTAPSSDFLLKSNWGEQGGTTGSQATLVRKCGVASRAFHHDGRAYFWATFAKSSTSNTAQLQNSYFLYREDGLLVAKAVNLTGGGFSASTGHLPGVQSLGSNKYAAALIERRIISLGQDQKGYSDRGPREVVVAFDSNEARRTAQIGETLYIAGAQLLQYDGEGLAEVGFHVFPYDISVVDPAIAGNLAAGTYTWRSTVRWENAKGELDRSTTATFFNQAIAASRKAAISVSPVHVTMKTDPRSNAAFEIWRTLVDPVYDAPSYLVTSKDPTASGDNGYLENDPTAAAFATYYDNFGDSTLDDKETYPETGTTLESLAPPACSIVAASDERLFLAGIPGQPYAILYSKTRGLGEVAAFSDLNRIDLPPTGGEIKALAILNNTLIAFKERAIYAVPGLGYANDGGGQNYGPATQIAVDVGASSADALGITPAGIFFHSLKGWFLVDRSWSIQYIGDKVKDYDADTFTAVHVLEGEHQIRCFSTSRCLAYDYDVGEWSEWELSGLHAAIYGGVYHYIAAAGTSILSEDAAHGGTAGYSLQAETAWIPVGQLMDFGRVRRIMILGEYRSAHDLKIEVARDYLSSYFDVKTWTVSPTDVGEPLQVRHTPTIQQVQAIKIRITTRAVGADTPPSGEAIKLTGIGLEIGYRGGLKRLPAAQKQ